MADYDIKFSKAGQVKVGSYIVIDDMVCKINTILLWNKYHSSGCYLILVTSMDGVGVFYLFDLIEIFFNGA